MAGTSGRVARNSVFLGLATVCNYAFSFLTVAYAARVLQPEAMGSVSFAVAVVSYFSLLSKMGIPLYGMREVAAARGAGKGLAQLTTELFCLGALLALIATALLAMCVGAVPNLAVDWQLYAVLGVGLTLDCLGNEWLYRGLERYRLLLVRDFAVRAVVFVLLVLLVHNPEDLLWYAALSALTTVGSAVVGFALTPRVVRDAGAADEGALGGWFVRGPKDLMRHVRPSLVFFLMSCATLIYANLDIVMLGFMATPAEVGYYQIAAKARVALIAVSGIVWNAALPQATQLWEQGKRDEFEALARRTMGLVYVVQAVVTVAFFVFAEPAVVIVAGEDYLPAVPAFRVLLLCLVPVAVSNILGGQVLIPAGRERWLLVSEVCGALANLVLNFVLIPTMGGVGAAVSTVVAEVVVALGAYAAVRVGLRLKLFPWDRGAGQVVSGLVRRARRAWYLVRYGRGDGGEQGSVGYCPCCDTPVPRWAEGRWLEQGSVVDVRRYERVRQDVLCPVCGALPRHRMLAWHLGQHPELVRGRRVLYFAPEASMERWMCRNGVAHTTADLYAPADLRLDIQDTGLEAGSWDVVVCNHVLEHVADWRRAVSDLRRVLAPGGLLICSFPIDPSYETVDEDASVTTLEGRIARFGQRDHLRVFGRDSAELLGRAGFEVEEVRGEDLPERILPVVGPADYDANVVFVCRRS